MSYQEDMDKWFKEEFFQDNDPESVFSMVTMLPEKKLKITSYLEDKDGNRISLKDMAIQMKEFILKHLRDPNLTAVNSQIFPLLCQFMMSVVPRATEYEIAYLMFTSPSMKQAMIFYGISSFLLAQYIQQHGLKIITEEETLTDNQIRDYYEKARESEETLRKILGG